MAQVQPYLMFSGNCEEAVKFYCEVFQGEIQFTQRYKDSPSKDQTPTHWQEKIMHMNFKIRGDQLMASDCFPGREPVKGNNIALSVSFAKNEVMDGAFNKLAQGGQVTMALQEAFWGARFGQLVDRYGISWMFNQELEKTK
jgi:PhnB protein